MHRKCNLYVYFLFLALRLTRADGLVSLIVPFEWTSRPAARPLRQFIREREWGVDIYRFEDPIFPGVLTTASISIVDKAKSDGRWSYYDVEVQDEGSPTNSSLDGSTILAYEDGGSVHASRGLSPGSQRVFTLTEGERVHAGLAKSDVVPCVTSLKWIPPHLERLTAAAFRKRFVEAGARCWLVRSYEDPLSGRLRRYLDHVPEELRDTATCRARSPWYRFRCPSPPLLLVSSGFTGAVPKVVCNSIRAIAVGGTTGVHSRINLSAGRLREYLHSKSIDDRVVPHAKGFTKLEIRQLNTLLNRYDR